jgi:hypothetical protein
MESTWKARAANSGEEPGVETVRFLADHEQENCRQLMAKA